MSQLSISLAALLCAATLHAQESVRGTVQDPQGKPVDGAALTLYRPGAAAPAALGRTRARVSRA